MRTVRRVAYFSMEIGLRADLPTYSGGLGVLAGDTLRAAADLRVPMVGMTLLYRKGYFRQRLEADGTQVEEPVVWSPEDVLESLPERVSVTLGGRTVMVGVWQLEVRGVTGGVVPVYFLDTDLPQNSVVDQTLVDQLYGGDEEYRFSQEVVLGIGGLRMLRELGHNRIERFHMNEGHAALLPLELLNEAVKKHGRTGVEPEDLREVRRRCVFTTHTPVAAGHDKFPRALVDRIFTTRELAYDLKDVFKDHNPINMTRLGLAHSGYVNAVSVKHQEVARAMFPGESIAAITNGVHAATWVAKPLAELYDRHLEGWRRDNFRLRHALVLPGEELHAAHTAAKARLIERLNESNGGGMKVETLTLGFARRAATYKRGDLLFHDPERLKRIAATAGGLQVVYGGKAHPRDLPGKEVIRRIFKAREALDGDVRIVYLEDYDMDSAGLLVAGVDVWLNTPEPPLEASGTSGMKAALNGVPSLSIGDGWWLEGYIEGVTGWAVGPPQAAGGRGRDHAADAASLYDKLETSVVPLYTQNREAFVDVMRHAIALNGAHFNAQRMLGEYLVEAYRL